MPRVDGPAVWLEPDDDLYKVSINDPRLHRWLYEQGVDPRWPVADSYDKQRWRWFFSVMPKEGE